jgi:hypothetical protein
VVLIVALALQIGCPGPEPEGEDEECPVGAAGCACTSGGACDGQLICVDQLCAAPGGCGDGIVDPGEDCDGSDPTNASCDGGCDMVCDPGFRDCNDDADDGCEIAGLCPAELLIPGAGFWPLGLVARDGVLYWVDYDPDRGALRRVGVEGGDVTTILGGQLLPFSLAVDDNEVFWVNNHSDGAVLKIPRAGGEPTTLRESYLAWDIAVDDDHVFWITGNQGGVVSRTLKSGASHDFMTERVLPQPRAIALYGDDVYWVNRGMGDSDGSVMSMPKDASAEPTTLVDLQPFCLDIAVSADGVFWLNRGLYDPTDGFDDGQIKRAALDGSSPQLLAGGQGDPEALTLGGQHVYWANGGSGELRRVGVDGGEVETMAEGYSNPCSLTYEDGVLYWTDCGDGNIYRLRVD